MNAQPSLAEIIVGGVIVYAVGMAIYRWYASWDDDER
jgi:hypothetical protein